MKNLTLRFIDMRIAARQPRTQAVRALVNDVEIVVDPFEARQQGMTVRDSMIGPEQEDES